MTPFFLGIDTSTAATKALLMDAQGVPVAVAAHEYPYATPRPLWSEQDPALWWTATCASIRATALVTELAVARMLWPVRANWLR